MLSAQGLVKGFLQCRKHIVWEVFLPQTMANVTMKMSAFCQARHTKSKVSFRHNTEIITPALSISVKLSCFYGKLQCGTSFFHTLRAQNMHLNFYMLHIFEYRFQLKLFWGLFSGDKKNVICYTILSPRFKLSLSTTPLLAIMYGTHWWRVIAFRKHCRIILSGN